MTALVKLCCALLLQIARQVRRLLQADRLLKMLLVPVHVGHLLREYSVAIALQLTVALCASFFLAKPEGGQLQETVVGLWGGCRGRYGDLSQVQGLPHWAMAKQPQQNPLVCHGHTRPIVELSYRWVRLPDLQPHHDMQGCVLHGPSCSASALPA